MRNNTEIKNNSEYFFKGIVNYKQKKYQFFLLAIFIMMSCGGGGGSKAGSNGKSQPVFEISDGFGWRVNDICAMVFIGYAKDFASISQTGGYATFCERFPSLRKTTKFAAETEGDEVYYIIPRYSDATVTVNEYKVDLEDNMKEIIGKKLYEGEATPLLIKCNLSDLHPNTTVTITGNGKSITFNPVSAFGERGDLLFVAPENEFAGEDIRAGFSPEYNYYGISAGITAKVTNGRVSLSYDKEEAAFILGETDFILEESFDVEGLSGACKGVFIGNVGQDFNPVLCCLLDDGGIEVLELYDALRSYDFRTSGRLHGYDNVVSVSNEGVQYSDEGGGYVTLFTLDSAGNKKEVDFNALLSGTWIHQTKIDDYDVRFIVYLSMDWKVSYVCGYIDSDVFEGYLGACWIIEESENVIVYEYEMKESDRSEMTGEAPDPAVKKGTFKVQKIKDDWVDGVKITCLTGLRFHPGELGKEEVFINKYRIN